MLQGISQNVKVWLECRQLGLQVGPEGQPGDQVGGGIGYWGIRSGSGSAEQ